MRTINPDQLGFKSTASSTHWCAHWAVQSQRDGTAWKSLADLHFQICDRLRANSSAVGLHMTACPICGSDPCINPNFCRACRDADRRKARGERPCHAPLRPVPPPMADLPKANLDSKSWKEIAAEAWTSPSWKQAALEYHHARGNRTLIVEIRSEDLARLRRLMSDSVSLDRAWDEITRTARERYNEAPKATYDA